MSKILAVFGATGQQGSSIINNVLNDQELSQQFKLRAITRDVTSSKSKQLQEKNVEVVAGDTSDRASLEKALAGVHTVFAMTMPDFAPGGAETEYSAGKTIADVAVAQGAKYIIFSTLPHVSKMSGGKYTKVLHFDAKARAEEYIRSLPIDSAFISPGGFMQNFHNFPMMAPQKADNGTWVMARHNSPQARLPLIDTVGDMGKYVGAILAEPQKYKGKTFCANTKTYSFEEIATIMSKASGKTVVYKQIPVEEFRASLPFAQDIFVESFSYPEEFGFYGPETEELVAGAASNARGKPATFEEYLEANPLNLV